MCRILFQYKAKTKEDEGIQFMNALDTMEEGGPDSQGVIVWKVNETSEAYFGSRRLSILDLSDAANQPMVEHGDGLGKISVLIYNGEIYNFKELKKKYNIKTESSGDTEVLFKLLQLKGPEIARELDGEFAFVYYDVEANEAYAVTDPMGIKPLYLHMEHGKVLISSEIKAILPLIKSKGLGRESLEDHLLLGWSELPAFETVSRINPGSITTIKMEKDGHGILDTRVYMPNIAMDTFDTTRGQQINVSPIIIRETIEEAVVKRMISDVPISLTLSGGIDSSILAYLMAKHSKVPINTYSIGFEGQPNEFKNARLMAKFIKSNHTEIVITKKEILDNIDDILMTMEAPSDRGSMIPTYFLARAIKEKVTLIGEGADEVFGGYSRYTKAFHEGIIGNTPSLDKYSQEYLTQFPDAFKKQYGNQTHGLYPARTIYLHTDGLGMGTSMGLTDGLQKAQIIDLNNEIVYYHNPRIDKMMMHFGVEARVPFLDPAVVRLGLQMTNEQKLNPPKNTLREAFRGLVPDAILDQEKKPLKYPYSELEGERTFEIDLEFGLEHKLVDPKILKKISDLPEGTRNKDRMTWAYIIMLRWIRLMEIKYGATI